MAVLLKRQIKGTFITCIYLSELKHAFLFLKSREYNMQYSKVPLGVHIPPFENHFAPLPPPTGSVLPDLHIRRHRGKHAPGHRRQSQLLHGDQQAVSTGTSWPPPPVCGLCRALMRAWSGLHPCNLVRSFLLIVLSQNMAQNYCYELRKNAQCSRAFFSYIK